MVDFNPWQFLYPFEILSFKRELARCSKLSRQELVDLQNKKLRELIVYTAEYVPFYRRFFKENRLKPQDIRTQNDLGVLPIITKKMIRETPDDFLSDVHKKFHPYQAKTSGSTGDAFKFYVGKDSKAAIFALLWHVWEINGYKPYDRWMNFKGSTFTDGTLMKYSRLLNCIGIPCRAITDDVASRIYDALLAFRPKHIVGYSSFIYDFCNRFAGDRRLLDLGVRQVMTNSEMLYDFQKAALEETFGCRVSNFYHQFEQVCCIFECEHQKKHLAHEYGVLEVVDENGAAVPDGQVGTMVCTGFFNRAMPFIRYQLDDLIKTSASPEICSCGRQHQMVESLEGRGPDTIISKAGNRYTHIRVAVPVLIGLSGLQIIQNDPSGLELKLIKNRFWEDSMLAELTDSIKKHTQGEFELKISFVPALKKTANGKQSLVVCNIPSEKFVR